MIGGIGSIHLSKVLKYTGILILASALSYQNKTIGIYYIYSNQYNPDWVNIVDRGMSYAIPRLNEFFNNFGINWSYRIIGEIQIDYLFIPDKDFNLPSRLDETVPLIFEVYPQIQYEYDQYDLIIFVFGGNMGGAYSYNYKAPIYASEGMFKKEDTKLTLIEHELLHTFGLSDHNWPYDKTIYANCIMGNLSLGKIILGEDSLQEFYLGAFQKYQFNELVQIPSSEYPPPVESPKDGIAKETNYLEYMVLAALGLYLVNWIRNK